MALLNVVKIEIGDTVFEGGEAGVTVPGESITQTIKIADDPVRNHCNGFKDKGCRVTTKIIPSRPKIKGKFKNFPVETMNPASAELIRSRRGSKWPTLCIVRC